MENIEKNKELIKSLYISGKSTREIGKIFDCSRETIGQCLKKQGVKMRKGRCSERDEYGRFIQKGQILPPMIEKDHPNYGDGGRIYRKIAEKHHKKECFHCLTKDKRLDVHHIDRNRKNNHHSNLRWVCHRCHMNIEHPEILTKMRKGLKKYLIEKGI